MTGLTHEALLILARQFWFSGGRFSSQEKKPDRCNFNFKLNIFISNQSKVIVNDSKIMHLLARMRPWKRPDPPHQFHALALVCRGVAGGSDELLM
jgi:hypothetical protein